LARRPRERGTRAASRDDVQRIEGIHPALEALRARRRPIHRLWVREGLHHPELEALRALAREAGIAERPLVASPEDPPTRGVVLDAGPLPELTLGELLRVEAPLRTLVALDGVEDPQNLGAIARVAEAVGAAGLILTRRRAPPLAPSVARASAGAIEWLPVARVPNLARALGELKQQGFWVFGADAEGGDDLFGLPERTLRGDRVLVLGAEGWGLRPAIWAQVDHRIRIPMLGHVASLNVSAAAAVLLFELRRRQGLAHPA
jgi:23S rRNA (guanosine2251-2'-O)-methyltransferase